MALSWRDQEQPDSTKISDYPLIAGMYRQSG